MPSRLLLLSWTLLLAGGCGSSSNPPGVAKDAVLLPPGDRVGVSQLGSGGAPETFEFETGGAIYVVEADTGRVRYSGPVAEGQQVLIYPSGVGVAGVVKTLAGKTLMERRVANFDLGRKYRIYVHPGGTPEDPTPDVTNNPLTRPYMIQKRVDDPSGTMKE